MKSLFWILLVGTLAYAFGDFKSSGLIEGFAFPFLFALSVVALVVWVGIRIGHKGRSRDAGSSDGCGSGFFGGDGDGGGCGGD